MLAALGDDAQAVVGEGAKTTFDGSVIAPEGPLLVSGNSVLNGTITCNSLTLIGGAIIDRRSE